MNTAPNIFWELDRCGVFFQVLLDRSRWPRVRRRLQELRASYAAVPMPDGRQRVLATVRPDGEAVVEVGRRTAQQIMEVLSADRKVELSPDWERCRVERRHRPAAAAKHQGVQ